VSDNEVCTSPQPSASLLLQAHSLLKCAKEASPSPSQSLASRLSAFSPPSPGPEQLCTAGLVQCSGELAALAEAARCAASACPESIPLVEVLCAAVHEELVVLNAEQAAAATNKTLNATAVAMLNHRVCDLRAATAEGLQALRKALEACDAEGEAAESDVDDAQFQKSWIPKVCQVPVVAEAPAQACTTLLDNHCSQREVAKIFGAVASNMKQAVLEIRQTKARQAISRSDTLMGSAV